MIIKIIVTIATVATVATATLPLFATSAVARAPRVRVARICEAYNNAGQQVTTLRVGEYYQIVRYMRFQNSGDPGVTVTVWDAKQQRNGTLNISTRCLDSSQGKPIEYN